MKKTLIVAAVLGWTAAVLGAGPAKTLQVKGSDTMVNLVQILAEEYMARTPGVMIAVSGGGSGTGITAIINRTTDIADSSRDWKRKEIDQAWEKGVTPRLFPIAVDGLSIVVNAANPLDTLTMAQVGSLYRGEIKSWKVLGGPDRKVTLYGRQSNSGTYAFMQEHVLGNRDYSPDVREMNGNAQIVESVLQDEGGVGYVGVGYLYDENRQIRKGLKVLKIAKAPGGAAYLPTDEAAIDSGAYPISRALYQATAGKPSAEAAKFIAWETGPEGQAIVEREGFYPIGDKLRETVRKNLE